MIREVLVLSCDECGFALIQGRGIASDVEDDTMMENVAKEHGWQYVTPKSGFGGTKHYCGQCARKRRR